MKVRIGRYVFAVVLLVAIFSGPRQTSAYPSFFDNECASCHSNDSSTCNGCHHHGPVGLSAQADRDSFGCGEQVTVTLSGGSQSGWIRALLFDHDGLEIDRASGPTGAGDDGGANPVEFPVTLTATAPIVQGTYVWEAAWWGSPYDVGNFNPYPHGPEVRVPVVVRVVGPSPVEASTWGRLKALFR